MSSSQSPLRIAFAGSPAFAATILGVLHASRYGPCAVFTQPDRPTGRGRKLTPNPVKKLAASLDLPVHQPPSLRDAEARGLLAQYELDILVVAAYGLILPAAVLQLPRFGCLNVHASSLPRWRGAAPIERAVMAGDRDTGVCIMQMEEGLDTGPVYRHKAVPISRPTDTLQLEQTLASKGSELLIEVLDDFAATATSGTKLPQAAAQIDSTATYAHKLTAADRAIDWSKSASSIADQINALGARMATRCLIGNCGIQLLAARAIEQQQAQTTAPPGSIVEASKRALLVQCATGLLQVDRLRIEKGKGTALDAKAAVNGFRDVLQPGAHLVEPNR